MVVHGAGRVPNIAGLDLNAGGVAVDERGIAINPYLQSISNPSVYVTGDANARGKPLSPVATRDGRAAARNMIQGNKLEPGYMTVPGVVFVSPLLASVGLREDQVAKRGMTAVVHQKETPDWYSVRRVGMTRSGYTILTEGKSGRIIGAHLLGYNADEMINVFALAIRTGADTRRPPGNGMGLPDRRVRYQPDRVITRVTCSLCAHCGSRGPGDLWFGRDIQGDTRLLPAPIPGVRSIHPWHFHLFAWLQCLYLLRHSCTSRFQYSSSMPGAPRYQKNKEPAHHRSS